MFPPAVPATERNCLGGSCPPHRQPVRAARTLRTRNSAMAAVPQLGIMQFSRPQKHRARGFRPMAWLPLAELCGSFRSPAVVTWMVARSLAHLEGRFQPLGALNAIGKQQEQETG